MNNRRSKLFGRFCLTVILISLSGIWSSLHAQAFREIPPQKIFIYPAPALEFKYEMREIPGLKELDSLFQSQNFYENSMETDEYPDFFPVYQGGLLEVEWSIHNLHPFAVWKEDSTYSFWIFAHQHDYRREFLCYVLRKKTGTVEGLIPIIGRGGDGGSWFRYEGTQVSPGALEVVFESSFDLEIMDKKSIENCPDWLVQTKTEVRYTLSPEGVRADTLSRKVEKLCD